MLRLRSEPASPQDGLPGGALRLAGRCALRAPPWVAPGCHDGNEGEWKESEKDADSLYLLVGVRTPLPGTSGFTQFLLEISLDALGRWQRES